MFFILNLQFILYYTKTFIIHKLYLELQIIVFKLTAEYEFQLTCEKANFEKSRKLCANMGGGGDLITVNLGPKGKQYHELVKSMYN